MDNGGSKFRSESGPIKKEPGPFIKSEFGPSLSSVPMAPTTGAKKEPAAGNQSALANIPRHRGQGVGGRHRRRVGNSLVVRVDGYHIRAHYRRGEVDFTVSKNTDKAREIKWTDVEREMFQKFHNARFYIEPTERPGSNALDFCAALKSGAQLRLSVRVHETAARLQEPTTSGLCDAGKTHSPVSEKDEVKNDGNMRDSNPASAGRATNLTPRFPDVPFPGDLPPVTSCQITDSTRSITFNIDPGTRVFNAPQDFRFR